MTAPATPTVNAIATAKATTSLVGKERGRMAVGKVGGWWSGWVVELGKMSGVVNGSYRWKPEHHESASRIIREICETISSHPTSSLFATSGDTYPHLLASSTKVCTSAASVSASL